ncbi:MAG: glycosyl transferase family 2 [Citrobacter freundii]|nr:MAG: glycosyl transferase family 2 [Citrobacter freundii]
MSKKTTVGLLISTYNWPEALSLVLQSVFRQSRLPDEIIVADDGSSPETQRLVSEYASKSMILIKHIWQEDNGFRKSLILNKAMQQSDADYIIEIDGDILLHDKFIEDHCRYAQVNSFVQGARVMIGEQETKDLLRTGKLRSFSFLAKGISNRFNSLRLPLLTNLMKNCKQEASNIKACNLAFWRRDFILVNGYNNQFEGWGCEDAEFVARLLHAGIKKRRLKLAAICYHLYHSLSSKHNIVKNEEIYEATVKGQSPICRNGYLQVQKAAFSEPINISLIEVQLPNPSIAS